MPKLSEKRKTISLLVYFHAPCLLIVFLSYVMDRTLVFPPPHGWYLSDWGPRKRMKSADTSGLSDYPDYFYNPDLQMAVPTISTAEFLRREGKNLSKATVHVFFLPKPYVHDQKCFLAKLFFFSSKPYFSRRKKKIGKNIFF